MDIILTELRDLKLRLRNRASAAAVDLLADTTWGTPGGTQYRHLDTRNKIHDMRNAFYLELWKGERLLGVVNLAGREVEISGKAYSTFYIRYFAIAGEFQRKTTTSDARPIAGGRNSLLKLTTRKLFDDPRPLMEATGKDHAIFYAYVELENQRSRDMCRNMAFSPVGKFSTFVFSRYAPRRQDGVRRITEADKPFVMEALRRQYAGHAFFAPLNLFYGNQYYVREEGGKIVAGLQANPVRWVFEHMPGFSGKLIMNLVPRMPVLSRLFNPKDHRFVAVEGMFCRPGHEADLYRLLHHACRENDVRSALMWLDPRDPLKVKLPQAGRLGLLQRLNSDTPVDVIARFVNVPASVQKAFSDHPVYISAFDVT